MLEFTDLQKKAKHLPANLTRAQSSSLMCVSFFSSIRPSTDGNMTYATQLAALAEALDKAHDPLLIAYLKEHDEDCVATTEALLEFKTKTLLGMYLLLWSKSCSWVYSYLHLPNALISQFKQDLLITSPAEINKKEVSHALYCLSRYCAFIYKHKDTNSEYKVLEEKLDPAIQSDIEILKTNGFDSGSFDYRSYLGNWCNEHHSKTS